MADDDTTVDNGRINGVEVHHEIPTQVMTEDSDAARAARKLLNEIGFNTESKANKIALPINAETRDKIASSPAMKQAFLDAGGGFNTHDSA
jgi:hypothetical protein